MTIHCDSRSSRPASLFSFSLVYRLQVCLRRLRLRTATVDFGLDCLTKFMNNPRST